jgi:hypothetical protein
MGGSQRQIWAKSLQRETTLNRSYESVTASQGLATEWLNNTLPPATGRWTCAPRATPPPLHRNVRAESTPPRLSLNVLASRLAHSHRIHVLGVAQIMGKAVGTFCAVRGSAGHGVTGTWTTPRGSSYPRVGLRGSEAEQFEIM